MVLNKKSAFAVFDITAGANLLAHVKTGIKKNTYWQTPSISKLTTSSRPSGNMWGKKF